jgi:hypothetical protein
MTLSHRRTGWLLVAGAVYAIVARGWAGIVVPGLLPGAGYNPLVNGDGARASMFADVEFGLAAVLPGVAICWVIVGLARRSLRAIRALGIAYLIDCSVYIGSVAFMPAATPAGLLSRLVIVALLQAPLIAIAIYFATIREPASNSATRLEQGRLDRSQLDPGV